jgi:hypothetical protein
VTALVVPRIELPPWLGELCWLALVEKAAGHKYVRRVPTGNPEKPWRYYYTLTGGQGRFNEAQVKEGAKFKLGDGHVHVREAGPDGHVQVTHDETGETHTLHRDHLANLLEDHHAEEVRTVQAKKAKVAEKKRLALPKNALDLARIITSNNDNKIRQVDTYGNATARTLDPSSAHVLDWAKGYIPEKRWKAFKAKLDDLPPSESKMDHIIAEVARAAGFGKMATWDDLLDGGEFDFHRAIEELAHDIDSPLLTTYVPDTVYEARSSRDHEQWLLDQEERGHDKDKIDGAGGDTSFDFGDDEPDNVVPFARSGATTTAPAPAPKKRKPDPKVEARKAERQRMREQAAEVKAAGRKKRMAKAFTEELPRWLGILLAHSLEKGMGHKYIRRVPTGNPDRPWRYFYRVTGGAQLGHDSELVEGAAFRVKDEGKEGHFHVTAVDGDKITIKHDETGKTATVSREALRTMLHEEHAEKIETARASAQRDADAAAKHGNDRQKKRAADAAAKLDAAFKPKPKPHVSEGEAVVGAAHKGTKTIGKDAKTFGSWSEAKAAAEAAGIPLKHVHVGVYRKKDSYDPKTIAIAHPDGSGYLTEEGLKHYKAPAKPEPKPTPKPAEPGPKVEPKPEPKPAAVEKPSTAAATRKLEEAAKDTSETPAPTPKAKEPKVASIDSDKLERVGDHIWGSRKDLAGLGRIENSKQLETMSYADAAAVVSKAKILEPMTLEAAKGLGMSPGTTHMSLAMLAAIRAKPGDNAAERAAFVDELRQIEGALKRIKTLDEFEAFRNEMYTAHRYASEWKTIGAMPMKDMDALKAKLAQLKKDNPGKEYRIGTDYGNYTHKIVEKVNRPFEALGRNFVSFISAKRQGPHSDAYTRALTLDDAWGAKIAGGGGIGFSSDKSMTTDEAWAWLAASNKPAEKATAPKTKRGETARGWSGAKDVAGEIVRKGGSKSFDKADPKRAAETFGLREVDFGEYLSQADREYHAKALEEAFHDFAEVLGVDPKIMSFNGRMGVALGARGRGKAAAHYEPSRKVINVTKFRGGGSVAHEWGHALDNVIAGHYIAGGEGSAKGDAFLTRTPEHSALPEDVKGAVKEVLTAIQKHPDPESAKRAHQIQLNKLNNERNTLIDKNNALVAEHGKLNRKPADEKVRDAQVSRLEQRVTSWGTELADLRKKVSAAKLNNKYKRNLEMEVANREYWVKDATSTIAKLKGEGGVQTPADKARLEEIKAEIEEIRLPINRANAAYNTLKSVDPTASDYVKSANALGADYWGSNEELFARAFESYAEDQLRAAKRQNTYLVDGTTLKYLTGKVIAEDVSAQPYPHGAERANINKAIGKLIDVLKGGKHLEKAVSGLDDDIEKAFGKDTNMKDDLIKSDMLYSGDSLPWWIRRYAGSPLYDAALELEKDSMETMASINERRRKINLANPSGSWRNPEVARQLAALELEQAEADDKYAGEKDKLAIDYVGWLQEKGGTMQKGLEADEDQGPAPRAAGPAGPRVVAQGPLLHMTRSHDLAKALSDGRQATDALAAAGRASIADKQIPRTPEAGAFATGFRFGTGS